MAKRSKGQRARRKARIDKCKAAVDDTTRTGLDATESSPAPQRPDPAKVVPLNPVRRARRAGRSDRAWPGGQLVIDRWSDIIGADIAKHAVPVSCDGGVLTLRAVTAVWATQLRMVSEQIVSRITSRCGDGIVSRVEIMRPADTPPDRPPMPSERSASPTTTTQRSSAFEPKLGATRLAERMEDVTGLPVEPADVWELVHLGYLEEADTYKGHAMYRVYDAENLCNQQYDLVESIVSERIEWWQSSYDEHDARRVLGIWQHEEFTRITGENAVWPGRDNRYSAAEIDALAGNPELQEQIRRARLLGPDQAAKHLGIRRRDFDYCVAAGWITPADQVSKDTRGNRSRTVEVPLFRVGDVDDLLLIPIVDWDAVRSTPPGSVSLLAQFAPRQADRATAVRRFVDRIARQHGVEAAAEYWWHQDQWAIRWQPDLDGTPTLEVIAHELTVDPDTAAFVDDIMLEIGSIDDARFARYFRHRAIACPTPQPSSSEWNELETKLTGRLSRPGVSPGISCRDAQTLAEKLRDCGVAPMRLGNEQSWQGDAAMVPVDLDTSDEISMLAGKLEDSVEYRFAPNLTKREARQLLDFITTTERNRCQTGDAESSLCPA